MPRNIKQLILLFFLLCFASKVWGQDNGALAPKDMAEMAQETPSLAAFLKKSRERQVPESLVQEVLRQSKSLQDRGLPIEPYLLKANEGLAKGVVPDKMLPALSKTRSQTEWAGSLVSRAERQGLQSGGPESKRMAILRLQNALKNEIPPQNLESSLLSKENILRSQRSLDAWSGDSRSFLPSRIPYILSARKSMPLPVLPSVSKQPLPETQAPSIRGENKEKEHPHSAPKKEKDLEKDHGAWKKHSDEEHSHGKSSVESPEKQTKERGEGHYKGGGEGAKPSQGSHGKHGKN